MPNSYNFSIGIIAFLWLLALKLPPKVWSRAADNKARAVKDDEFARCAIFSLLSRKGNQRQHSKLCTFD
jgi:hypothetical protein